MTNLVFLGDSLVADYDWQANMAGYKVKNFGVPGNMSLDLLLSLSGLKSQMGTPDIIVVMIGTNDLLADNDEYLVNLKKILIQLSHDFPATEILVNGLFPMKFSHFPDNTVASLNTHIEAITMRTGCCYLDIGKRFATFDKPIFQADGVHLTDAAYSSWTRGIKEHIAFLIENE